MKSTKKKLFAFLLFSFLIVGSINSLKTGISFDENYEELNWNFNVNVTKDFLNSIISNKDFNYENFNSKVKNFVGYGIGFQFISQPIQNFEQCVKKYLDLLLQYIYMKRMMLTIHLNW